MYIPSAFALAQDFVFIQRHNSDLYDTPTVAKDILRSMRNHHKDILAAQKQEYDLSAQGVDGSALGETLSDLCEIGVQSQLPVRLCSGLPCLLHTLNFGFYVAEEVDKYWDQSECELNYVLLLVLRLFLSLDYAIHHLNTEWHIDTIFSTQIEFCLSLVWDS